MTELLLGLWMGYVSVAVFVLWDHQTTERHYAVKDWLVRQDFVPRKHVTNSSLLGLRKVHLPQQHTQLRLMKNFVKGLDKSDEGFLYLHSKS